MIWLGSRAGGWPSAIGIGKRMGGRPRRRLTRTIICAAMLALATTSVHAAEDYTETANFMLPYCRILATKAAFSSIENAHFSGICDGTVHSIAVMMSERGPYVACIPGAATVDQVTRVVVRYGELHPEKTHMLFVQFVINAIHDTWPCKR
jgi:hypothetical protein